MPAKKVAHQIVNRARNYRVEIIQRAFYKTVKDLSFPAEANKVRLAIDPTTSEEVQRVVNKMYSMSAAKPGKLKQVINIK